MIVAIKGFKGLTDLLAAVKESGFDAPRPSRCPGPKQCRCRLWRHTAYKRTAIDETGNAAEVTIQRYRCPACRLTLSCLFDFVIPYGQFTVQAVIRYVECYLRKWRTYEELAWSADGERCASKSSTFRWVDRLADRARKLGAAVQLEAVLSRPENAEMELEPVQCPNAIKVKKVGKAGGLNEGAECILLTERLVIVPLFADDSPLMTLQRYFLTAAETVWSIMTGRRRLMLSTQQSTKYAIF